MDFATAILTYDLFIVAPCTTMSTSTTAAYIIDRPTGHLQPL